MTVELSNLTATIHVSFAGIFFRHCGLDPPAASEAFWQGGLYPDTPRGLLQLLSMMVVLQLCWDQMGTAHC